MNQNYEPRGVLLDHDECIGLPPMVSTIRNSNRTAGACPRRWLLRIGEGLRPRRKARALGYGSAWHNVMEEIHLFWMRTEGSPFVPHMDCALCDAGCTFCDYTGRSALWRSMQGWEGGAEGLEGTTFRRNLKGWLLRWGDTPPSGLSVVGVEVPLAMPVRSAQGRLYSTTVYIAVDHEGGWRRARRGEVKNPPPGVQVVKQTLPVYLTGILDVVWRTKLGTLWVGEHKSSADPRRYLDNASVDPQVSVYENLLGYAVASGALAVERPGRHLAIDPGARVVGWRLCVSNSHMLRNPTILKKPRDGSQISRSPTRLSNVPSWLLRKALVELGEDPESQANQRALDVQRVSVDHSRFISENGSSGSELLHRTAIEIHTLAIEQHRAYRQSALLGSEDQADRFFPRIPVCRSEFRECPYISPCSFDGPFARSSLASEEVLQTQKPGDGASTGT